jgi:hypothetical protein
VLDGEEEAMARRTLTRIGAASTAADRLVVTLVLVAALGPVRNAYAQAEPAPEGYEPPSGVPISMDPRRKEDEREARRHRWVLAVQPRLVIALASNQGDQLPLVGFGAGVGLSGAFAIFGRSRLAIGFSFAYERRQHTDVPPPMIENGDTIEYDAHASFSADLKLESFFLGGVLRPWVMIGPAMSVATYSRPPTLADQAGLYNTQVLPGLRAGAGLAGHVAANVEIGGRVECLATFNDHALGVNGIHPLTPGNFSVGLDVGFRF